MFSRKLMFSLYRTLLCALLVYEALPFGKSIVVRSLSHNNAEINQKKNWQNKHSSVFKKNSILEPDEEVILKEDDGAEDEEDADENKRDILILPETNPNLSTQQVLQTIQNALSQNENQEANQQPVVSVNVGGSRRTKATSDDGIMYDSSLTKGQEEQVTDIVPTSLYESDTVSQMAVGENPLSSSPTEVSSRPVYEEYLPDEYKSTQGLQDSEEKLIGKLFLDPPKGTSTKWEEKDTPIETPYHHQNAPSYQSPGNDFINSILLDKALDAKLNQKKKVAKADCKPVPLSHIANCTNSTDPFCKDDDLDSFRKNGLHQHQVFRKVHGTPPLELNDKLNDGAQDYADKLAYADKLSYSDPKDRPGQGENIAVRCSDDGSLLTAKDAISYWYHKICKDETSLRNYSPEIGQFSQIIWKDTNFMGLGRSKRNKGDLTCTYIVARYSPEAIKSGFNQNVPHGDFDEDKSCPRICSNDNDKAIPDNITTSDIQNLSSKTNETFDKMKLVTDNARNQTDSLMNNSSSPTETVGELTSSPKIVHNGSVVIPSSSLKEKSNGYGNLTARSSTAQVTAVKNFNKTDEVRHPARIVHLSDNEIRELNNGTTTGFAFKMKNSTSTKLRNMEGNVAEEARQNVRNNQHQSLLKNSSLEKATGAVAMKNYDLQLNKHNQNSDDVKMNPNKMIADSSNSTQRDSDYKLPTDVIKQNAMIHGADTDSESFRSHYKQFNPSSSYSKSNESRVNPDIVIFINKKNNAVHDAASESGYNDETKPSNMKVSSVEGSHGENLTIMEKEPSLPLEQTTSQVLQSFFKELTKTKGTKQPVATFIQLIPSSELSDFRHGMLVEHNKFRGLHHSAPLQLDSTLNKDAQIYAAFVAKHASVAHSSLSSRPNTGESVAELCTKEGVLPTPEHVVRKWYSEICAPGYDFNKRSKQSGTGHFTQLVWKDTKKLGVGLAVANHADGDSCSYVVSRYKNAGNYLDRFQQNVQRGSFDKRTCAEDESAATKSTIKYYNKKTPSSPNATKTPMAGTTGKSLEKINKEFATKYLLNGDNYLQHGKIFHIGSPQNFSFTPSQSWLDSFEKKAGPVSFKPDQKVNINRIISESTKSELSKYTPLRNFSMNQKKPANFRVRIDVGEKSEETDDNFLSRRKKDNMYKVYNRRRTQSVDAREKNKRISTQYESHMLLLRNKRNEDENLDPVLNKNSDSKKLVKGSKIIDEVEDGHTTELANNLSRLSNTSISKNSSLTVRNSSNHQNKQILTQSALNTSIKINEKDLIKTLQQRKIKEHTNLKTNATNKVDKNNSYNLNETLHKSLPQINLTFHKNESLKNIHSRAYEKHIGNFSKTSSTNTTYAKRGMISRSKSSDPLLDAETHVMNKEDFEKELDDIFGEESVRSSKTLHVHKGHQEKISTLTTPPIVPPLAYSQPSNNSNFNTTESQKADKQQRLQTSKLQKLKLQKLHSTDLPKTISKSPLTGNITKAHHTSIKHSSPKKLNERKETLKTMKKLIKKTNREEDLVQLLSKIVHKINRIDRKTRRNHNSFNDEISRFAELNTEAIRSYNRTPQSYVLFSKHSGFPLGNPTLLRLENVAKILAVSKSKNSIEDSVRDSIKSYTKGLANAMNKGLISDTQKRQLLEIMTQLDDSDKLSSNKVSLIKLHKNINMFNEDATTVPLLNDRQYDVGNQREDLVEPFIIRGESDGIDEYSFNEGSVDEGPTEDGSGNVEDGLLAGTITHTGNPIKTTGVGDISKKAMVTLSQSIEEKPQELDDNNYVNDFILEREREQKKLNNANKRQNSAFVKDRDLQRSHEQNIEKTSDESDVNNQAASNLLLRAAKNTPLQNEPKYFSPKVEYLGNAATNLILQAATNFPTSRKLGSSNPNVGLNGIEVSEKQDKEIKLPEMDKGFYHEDANNQNGGSLPSSAANVLSSPFEDPLPQSDSNEISKEKSKNSTLKDYRKKVASETDKLKNDSKDKNVKTNDGDTKTNDSSEKEKTRDEDTKTTDEDTKSNDSNGKEKTKDEYIKTNDKDTKSNDSNEKEKTKGEGSKANDGETKPNDSNEKEKTKDEHTKTNDRDTKANNSNEKEKIRDEDIKENDGDTKANDSNEKERTKDEHTKTNDRDTKANNSNEKEKTRDEDIKENDGDTKANDSNEKEKTRDEDIKENDGDTKANNSNEKEKIRDEDIKENDGDTKPNDSNEKEKTRDEDIKTTDGDTKANGSNGKDKAKDGEDNSNENGPVALRLKYKQVKEEKKKEKQSGKFFKQNKVTEKEELKNNKQARTESEEKNIEDVKQTKLNDENDVNSDGGREQQKDSDKQNNFDEEKESSQNSHDDYKKEDSEKGKEMDSNRDKSDDSKQEQAAQDGKNQHFNTNTKQNSKEEKDERIKVNNEKDDEKSDSKVKNEEANNKEKIGNSQNSKTNSTNENMKDKNITSKMNKQNRKLENNETDENLPSKFNADEKEKSNNAADNDKQNPKNSKKLKGMENGQDKPNNKQYAQDESKGEASESDNGKQQQSLNESPAAVPEKEKDISIPSSFVSEIVNKVSQKAHEMGLDKPLAHTQPATAVSSTENLAPINTPIEDLPKVPNDFEHSALIAHNKLRKIHNSPMLAFSAKLTRDAQNYALDLISVHGGTLTESLPQTRPDQGENLFMDCDTHGLEKNGEQATNKWYGEICEQGYGFGSEPVVYKGTEHFTQVVWKSSTQLGIGRVITKRNQMTCTIIVARYKPAGNIPNQFKANVEEGTFNGNICEALKDGHHATIIRPTLPHNDHPENSDANLPAPSAPPITISNSPNSYQLQHVMPMFEPDTIGHNQDHRVYGTNHLKQYPMHDTEDIQMSLMHHLQDVPSDLITNSKDSLNNVYVEDEIVKKIYTPKYYKKKNNILNKTPPTVNYHIEKKKEKVMKGIGKSRLEDAHEDEEIEVTESHHDEIKNAKHTVDFHPEHVNRHPKTIHVWPKPGDTLKTKDEDDMDRNTVENIESLKDANKEDNELAGATEPISGGTDKLVSALEQERLDDTPKHYLHTNLDDMEHHVLQSDISSPRIQHLDVTYNMDGDTRSLDGVATFKNHDSVETKDSNDLQSEENDASGSKDLLENMKFMLNSHSDASSTDNSAGESDPEDINKWMMKLKIESRDKQQKSQNANKEDSPKFDKEKNDKKGEDPKGGNNEKQKVDSFKSIKEQSHHKSNKTNVDAKNDKQSVKNKNNDAFDNDNNANHINEEDKEKLDKNQQNESDENKKLKAMKENEKDGKEKLDNNSEKDGKDIQKEGRDESKEKTKQQDHNDKLGKSKSKKEKEFDNKNKESDDKPELVGSTLSENSNEASADEGKYNKGESEPSPQDNTDKADEHKEIKPMKSKHVSGVSDTDRLPASQRPTESENAAVKPPSTTIRYPPENHNGNTISEGNGHHKPHHIEEGMYDPSHDPVAQSPWLKLPLGNSQPSPAAAQHLLHVAEKLLPLPIHPVSTIEALSPLHNPDSIHVISGDQHPMSSGDEHISSEDQHHMSSGDQHHMSSEEQHHISSEENNPITAVTIHSEEKPSLVYPLNPLNHHLEHDLPPSISHPLEQTTNHQSPQNEHTEHIDHGIAVAPVDEHTSTVQASGLGLLSVFRFASFGSPVVLHIGATSRLEDPASFLRTGLTVHNEFRKIHGSPPLKLDPGLTMQAAQHAQILASTGYLKHAPPQILELGIGENLFLGCYDGEYEISAEEAVLRWYAEVCHPGFCFDHSTILSGTSHFTQVIWKSSQKFGMAKAVRMQNGLRCTYIVAKYSPEGNVNDGFLKNVKKGNFEEKEVCADVVNRLVGFETRNMDKVKMVEREKQVARLEFLQKMKEGTAELVKEIAEHDCKVSQRPTNPLSEPPIVESEHYPDGSSPNKEGLQHHQNNVQDTAIQLQKEINQAVEPDLNNQYPNSLQVVQKELKNPFLELTELKEPVVLKQNSLLSEDNAQNPQKIVNGLKSSVNESKLNESVSNEVNKWKSAAIDQENNEKSRPEVVHLNDVHDDKEGNAPNPEPIDIKNMSASHDSLTLSDSPGSHTSGILENTKIAASQSDSSGKTTTLNLMATKTMDKPSVSEIAELTNSDEDNAIVELDLPKDGSTAKAGSKIATDGINENVLENMQAQNEVITEQEEIQPIDKMSELKPGDIEKIESMDNSDALAAKIPTEAYSVDTQSLDTSYRDPMTKVIEDRDQKTDKNSLESEIVEVTKLLDSNDAPGVKEKKIKSAEEKLIRDSKLHNIDVSDLINNEDEELSEEISKVRDKDGIEIEKDVNSNKEEEDTVTSNASKRRVKKLKVVPMFTTDDVSLHNPKTIPTKTFLNIKNSPRKLHGNVAKTYRLNSEDEAMVSDILSKSHSSVESNFDDALKAPFQNIHSRDTISKKKLKKISSKSKRFKCNSDRNDINNNCWKKNGKKMVPDPTEQHRDKEKHKHENNNSTDQLEKTENNVSTVPHTHNKHFKQDKKYTSINSLKLTTDQNHQNLSQTRKQMYMNSRSSPLEKDPNRTPEYSSSRNAMNDHNKAPAFHANPSLKSPRNLTARLHEDQHQLSSFKSHEKSLRPGNQTTYDVSLFEIDALKAHNAYRHTHGARSLRINRKMSADAMQYAKRIAKLGNLQHSRTEDGENIATVCRDKNILMTGPEASEIWYREVCDPGYDFLTAQPGNAGHFSQVVWKNSKELGIGRAAEMHDGLLCTYIVARYRPAGNFLGEFRDNVQQGRFMSSRCVNYARKDQISRQPQMTVMQPSYFNMPMYKRSGIPRIRDPRSLNETEEKSTLVTQTIRHLLSSTTNSTRSVISPPKRNKLHNTKKRNKHHHRRKGHHKKRRHRHRHRHRHRRRHQKKHETIDSARTNLTTKLHTLKNTHNSTVQSTASIKSRLQFPPLDVSPQLTKSNLNQMNGTKKTIKKPSMKNVNDTNNYQQWWNWKQGIQSNATNSRLLPNSTVSGVLNDTSHKGIADNHIVRNSSKENTTNSAIVQNSTDFNEKPFSYNMTIADNTQDYSTNVSKPTSVSNSILPSVNRTLNLKKPMMNSSDIHLLNSNPPGYNGSVDKDDVDNISIYRKLNKATGQAMNMEPSINTEKSMHNSSMPVQNPQHLNTANDKNSTLAYSLDNKFDYANNPIKNKTSHDFGNIPETNLGPNSIPNSNHGFNFIPSTNYTYLTKSNNSDNSIKKAIIESQQENPLSDVNVNSSVENLEKYMMNLPPSLSELESQLLKNSHNDITETAQLRSLIERDDDTYLNKMDDLIESKLKNKAAVIVPQSRTDRERCAEKGDYNCTFVMENNQNSAQNYETTSNTKDEIPMTMEVSHPAYRVLDQNNNAVPVAQQIAKDLIEGKDNDIVKASEDINLPLDLLLRKTERSPPPITPASVRNTVEDRFNSINTMEKILKMAKIGTIALKLAKRKAMQRTLAEKIHEESLQGIDLLKDMQYKQMVNPNPLSSKTLINEFYPDISSSIPNALIKNLPIISQLSSSPTLTGNAQSSSDLSSQPPPRPTLRHKDIDVSVSDNSNKLPAVEQQKPKETTSSGTQVKHRTNVSKTTKHKQDSDNQEFLEAALNAHNTYRYVHEVNPLLLDKQLIEHAQNRVEELARMKSLEGAKGNDDGEGENIAMVCKHAGNDDKLTGPDATRIWYNQVCNPEYVFDVDRIQNDVDKFVQVVWKETKKFGIARSTFENDGRFCSLVVARYSPGAAKLNTRSNVIQGSFDHSSYCNGLGKSSVPVEENTNTRKAIKQASQNTQDFRLEALNLQNQFRSIHHAQPIDLDDAMCVQAEEIATKMAKARAVKKSDGLEDGENAMKSCNINNVEVSADEAVRRWYNEVCNPGYSFLRGDIPGGVTSFTQMVWKPTNRFGIGKATSREDGMFCTYIVGLYKEKGNSRNDYYLNVLKGDFDFGYCDSLGKLHHLSYERYQRQNIEVHNQIHLNTRSAIDNSTIQQHSNMKSQANSNSTTSRNTTADSVHHVKQNQTIDPQHTNRSMLVHDKPVLSLSHSLLNDSKHNVSWQFSKDNTTKDSSTFKNNDKIKLKEFVSSADKRNFSSQSNTVTKRNHIPSNKIKTLRNKKLAKKHKVIIDNLMQLNDFVMKVNNRRKKGRKKQAISEGLSVKKT